MSRALPLSPEQRRAAIMAATEPLIERSGRDVTTRQIAEAAGVAEGTIFRVFPSKDALLDAVMEDALDPRPTCRALLDIDPAAPLEDRLTRAVGVLQDRMRRVVALFHALRSRPPEPTREDRRRREEDDARISLAIVALIQQDADQLRMPVEAAANLLRSLTFAISHPMLNRHHAQPELPPHDVVAIFLYGVTRARPPSPSPAPSPAPSPPESHPVRLTQEASSC